MRSVFPAHANTGDQLAIRSVRDRTRAVSMMVRSKQLKQRPDTPIDARPLNASSTKNLLQRTAGPYHWVNRYRNGSPRDVRLSPNSGGIADIPALRFVPLTEVGHPQNDLTGLPPLRAVA